jgi:hypothetical protein
VISAIKVSFADSLYRPHTVSTWDAHHIDATIGTVIAATRSSSSLPSDIIFAAIIAFLIGWAIVKLSRMLKRPLVSPPRKDALAIQRISGKGREEKYDMENAFEPVAENGGFAEGDRVRLAKPFWGEPDPDTGTLLRDWSGPDRGGARLIRPGAEGRSSIRTLPPPNSSGE